GKKPVHTFGILNTAGASTVTLGISSANASVTVGDGDHSLDGTGTLIVNGATGTTLTLDDEAVNRFFRDEGTLSTYQSDPGYPTSQIGGGGWTGQTHTTRTVRQGSRVLGQHASPATTNIRYSNLAGLPVKGGSAKTRSLPGDATPPLPGLPPQLNIQG